MTQLPLNITPLLSYEPEQFFVHSGVRDAVTAAEALLVRAKRSVENPEERAFQTLFIQGPPRSGKTHLLCTLAERAVVLQQLPTHTTLEGVVSGGLYPRTIDASAHIDWVSFLPARGCGPSDVFFVDSAHRYFGELLPGDSGSFVRFVEELRVAGAALIFFSAQAPDEFPCDEHARSRLRAGLGPALGPPTESEMQTLVKILARQRGIALTDRKLKFLERRLPREVKQLEEYLDRVQFISHMTGKPVRFPVLGDAL